MTTISDTFKHVSRNYSSVLHVSTFASFTLLLSICTTLPHFFLHIFTSDTADDVQNNNFNSAAVNYLTIFTAHMILVPCVADDDVSHW